MLYDSAARSAEVLRLNRRGPRPGQPLGTRHPQGRRPRRDRLEVPHGAAAVELAGGQAGRARIRHRARRAIGRLPRLGRHRQPGQGKAVVRTGRDAVPGVVGRAAGPGRDIAPAAARCPTHDLEDGASVPLLMTKLGHASIRSLAKYARPGTEALAAWQETDGPYPPRPRLTREERGPRGDRRWGPGESSGSCMPAVFSPTMPAAMRGLRVVPAATQSAVDHMVSAEMCNLAARNKAVLRRGDPRGLIRIKR